MSNDYKSSDGTGRVITVEAEVGLGCSVNDNIKSEWSLADRPHPCRPCLLVHASLCDLICLVSLVIRDWILCSSRGFPYRLLSASTGVGLSPGTWGASFWEIPTGPRYFGTAGGCITAQRLVHPLKKPCAKLWCMGSTKQIPPQEKSCNFLILIFWWLRYGNIQERGSYPSVVSVIHFHQRQI